MYIQHYFNFTVWGQFHYECRDGLWNHEMLRDGPWLAGSTSPARWTTRAPWCSPGSRCPSRPPSAASPSLKTTLFGCWTCQKMWRRFKNFINIAHKRKFIDMYRLFPMNVYSILFIFISFIIKADFDVLLVILKQIFCKEQIFQNTRSNSNCM